MSQSPFINFPIELISNITFYLDIPDIVNLIKLHAFTSIQAELKRGLDSKLLNERKQLEKCQKNYIEETLYFVSKDIKYVDLPDPFYIQNIFNERDIWENQRIGNSGAFMQAINLAILLNKNL